MSGMLQKSNIPCALLFAILIFNVGSKDDTPPLISAGGASNINFEKEQDHQDDDSGMTRELLLYGYQNFLLYHMFSASEI